MNALRKNIVNSIKNCKFTIAADMVSTKNLSHAFLGIVVHYVDFEKEKLNKAALDLVSFDGIRETAENIRIKALEALETFGLNKNNVIRVVTDGARNIRSAFL